jgi:hypothetical protein
VDDVRAELEFLDAMDNLAPELVPLLSLTDEQLALLLLEEGKRDAEG